MAVTQAVTAPDAREALDCLLAEAVRATGAFGGAVFEHGAPRPRSLVGLDQPAIHELLEGSPALLAPPALSGDEPVDTLTYRDLPPERSAGAAFVLVAPLHIREVHTGTLLLLFAGEPPPEPAREAAAAFAAVAALLLENERLQEEARAALQSREHFLVALNHELRTPAQALMLNADLLGSGALGEVPSRVARAVSEAESNVRLLIGILRRVVDLGQLGFQAAPERSDLVHPREAITEILRKMEPAAKRKGLALALYVPRTLPPLQTDPERFERVLLHLLSNAVKFTSHGSVEVRVERSRRSSGSHRYEPTLIVRIRDTGCGIPAAQLERVFEPFAQVEEGARSDSPRRGVGLGLPLARQLARSLRGDVLLESSPGQGTSATFVLPYHSP